MLAMGLYKSYNTYRIFLGTTTYIWHDSGNPFWATSYVQSCTEEYILANGNKKIL